MSDPKVIGILGAGRVGTAIARRALAAGYEVRVASSRPPAEIALVLQFVAPGAIAASAAEVVALSDIIVLALPLSKYRSLRPEAFAGKIVVDYDYTPCAPAEELTLNQRITDRYYGDLANAA